MKDRKCCLLASWFDIVSECAYPEKEECGFSLLVRTEKQKYVVCKYVVNEVGLQTMIKMNKDIIEYHRKMGGSNHKPPE